MKSAKSKRQFTLLTLVVALGVAVYLNWEYAKTDAPFALQDPGAVSANAAVETVTDGTHHSGKRHRKHGKGERLCGLRRIYRGRKDQPCRENRQRRIG